MVLIHTFNIFLTDQRLLYYILTFFISFPSSLDILWEFYFGRRMLWPQKVKNECESHSTVSDSLKPHGPYSPWNSPGLNTVVGSLSLLQGIFLTQGLNLGLPHCQQFLYQLSHKGSLRMLEWVADPFPSVFPNPGIKLGSPTLQVDSFTSWAIWPLNIVQMIFQNF